MNDKGALSMNDNTLTLNRIAAHVPPVHRHTQNCPFAVQKHRVYYTKLPWHAFRRDGSNASIKNAVFVPAKLTTMCRSS